MIKGQPIAAIAAIIAEHRRVSELTVFDFNEINNTVDEKTKKNVIYTPKR